MTVHAGSAAFPIALDRTSPVPLYHQLFEQFAAAIDRGVLRPGDTLEREDLLAERLDISRPTLRRALSDLAARGLLSRSRGTGTVIIGPSTTLTPPSALGPAAAVPQQVGGATGRAAMRVLRLDPDYRDPQAARELGLGVRSRLVYLEQLLVVDGRPVGLRRSWLPGVLVDPLVQDLTVAPSRRILNDTGHAVVAERRTFGCRRADPAETAALGVQASGEVFTVVCLAFDSEGAPVERVSCSYSREIDRYDVLLAAG